MMPRSMEKFSMKGCSVVNIDPRQSYLFKMHTYFQKLKHLDLSDSSWLSNHSLQAICKSDTMESLNLQGCKRIGEIFVYTALATRFGFLGVKVLDLRDTMIGDTEVPCFGRLPEVTTLYLGRTESREAVEVPERSESNGSITDRGVVSMCMGIAQDSTRHTKLTKLTLAWTEVSDKCLPDIAKSLPLTMLDVRGTAVTLEAVQRYNNLRPNCRVLHFETED